GAKKVEAALYLKEVIKDHGVIFVGLLETRINNVENTQIMKLLGDNWKLFMVPAVGLSGGLLILWRCGLADFTVVRHSSQMVVGNLKMINKGEWKIASVYGSTDVQERKFLWEDLGRQCDVDAPLIIGGDFNSIVKHLPRFASDHCPLVLELFKPVTSVRKDIRYEEIWATYYGATALVKKIWENKRSGSPADILSKKCKKSLRAPFFWSREKHKNLSQLKEDLKAEILEIQLEEAEIGISMDKLQILRSKINELNVTLARLNTWWKQRAKIRWMEEGDCNSNFFHSFANARRNLNWIHQIKTLEGEISEDEIVIQETFS
ncbi:uncharacterized protein LOC110104524, partial [Dendrobium catenatum]|uniref:uncharacterized protein LOC110104524 n=1 Tax=Dendrobium catenatum TaxID=906689 RepID=UPI0009F6918F